MTRILSVLCIALLVLVFAETSFATEPGALAVKAVSEDPSESSAAIAELRSMGPAGLQILLEAHGQQINRYVEDPTLAPTTEWLRITAALDATSQQRNSYLSGLYWYTDLAKAQQAAAASGRPILSLRLLGKLTDELSCANSRFFRSILYSNAEVAAKLREDFVLHWETVRPVPIITIDFGDGRKLLRTITGNSIHYVLDTDGRLIDALPGLYGPAAFMRGLADAETIFKELRGSKKEQRFTLLTNYYRIRINKISVNWLNDVTKIGGKPPEGVTIERGQNGEALSIMPLAVTKAITEATILRGMMAGPEALGRITDEATWKKIAALHYDDARLDERSIGLITRQTQASPDGPKVLPGLLQKLQESIALDTVRNEYRMHTKLYSWLMMDRSRTDVKAFNEKVYAELFATPRTDPWLGLVQPEAYTGLDNGGLVKN